MKNSTLFAIVSFLFLMVAQFGFSQNRGIRENDPQTENLLKLADIFHQQYLIQRAEVERVAGEKGWVIREESDKGVSEIIYIDESGFPQSYTTTNLNAGRTTNTDDIWFGGSTGLNLTGAGYIVGEWDGGGVLTTHQEFDNGAGTRVTQVDSPGSTNWHSTHVAGTIIGEGQVAAAHGMATNALLRAYEWTDDQAEMATAAAGGLTLSNHSYGWTRGWVNISGTMYWYGNTSISGTEDYLFGFYDASAQAWDQIAYNAPGYLIVKSAGNDRGESFSGFHYAWNGSSWVWSNNARGADGGANGYDCIDQRGVAKNILTVGAINDIPAGWTNPADVVMSTFSSYGPTDDGRIKPDLVANGVGVYSASNSGNAGYTTSDGTSMATPNTTGTLVLLQDYYKSLRGGTMSAAAMKGLVINTANEAGTADGPDYRFGWGLLNATGSTTLIANDNAQGGLIVQGILVNGQTTDYTYYSNGSEINVTLCWTDPAGTPSAASLNPTALKLVNNLNVRLISGSTDYYPWVLNPSSPAANATKGVNTRDNVETVNIKTPSPGYYTIRVSHAGALTNSEQAYALIVRGLSVIPNQTYCQARSNDFNSWEYIKAVQFGAINNTSGRSPGGYSDYRGLVTQMAKGSIQTITVTIQGYSGDDGKVWVDWNQDGDFSDPDETFNLGTGPGPIYSTTITVPWSALAGYTTMRVRLNYGIAYACGTASYGETEDYTIKVTGTSGLWAGTVSTDWNNPFNWDDGIVPNASVNVTIPWNTPFLPIIGNGTTANAASVYLYSGTSLTQNSTSWFNVYGDFDAGFGQFTMNGASSYLYLGGSSNSYWWDDYQDDTYTNVIIYKSGSAVVNMQTNMTCNVLLEVFTGVLSLNNAVLTVNGTSSTAFRVRNGGKLILDSSSDGVTVAGSVVFDNGSQAILSNGTISCAKDFIVNANASYDIIFTGGTLVMNGSSNQYINDLDGGNLDLNNLTIAKTGGACYIQSANLDVNGSLTITGGVLSSNNGPSPTATYNINLAGNWNNYVGDGGFIESSGRVIFDGGAYHQYCSTETFNILEVNKPAGGAFRPYLGENIVCAAYDWTAGAIDVIQGSFTANNLLDNGIAGAFYNNEGGTINLTNSSSGWVDLNGELHIYGGTFNVYGTISDWPYSSNALIEMSGGILDFHGCGISIVNSSYALATNITGGIIRTAYGFSGNRPDFTPTAGTIELYGTTDAFLSQSNGSTFWNVNIDKSAKNASLLQKEPEISEGRVDKTFLAGGKANGVNLYSNIVVGGNLFISSGTLNIGGYICSVAHIMQVAGILNMDNPAGVLNVGTYPGEWLYFTTGSLGNLSSGVINLPYALIVYDGATVTATTANTINFGTTLSFGGIANLGNMVLGNVNVNMNGGKWILDQSNTGPITVNGDFTVLPGNTVELFNNSLIIHGVLSDHSTSSIYVYDGPVAKGNSSLLEPGGAQPGKSTGSKGGILEIDNNFTLNGLMDVGDGNVLQHGIFHLASTGNLNITGGSFIADAPLHAKGWEYIHGHLGMTSGLFEISNNSIQFSTTGTSTVSGGIVRSGEAFAAINTGNFQPSGGTVEIVGVGSNTIYCDNGNYFYNLLINRDPAASSYFYTDITVNSNLSVNSGTLVMYLSTANVLGGVSVNGGNFIVSENGNLRLASGTALNVNIGGKLSVIGSSGLPAKISRISSGNYVFNVQSGGTIAAQYGIFEYMNTNGINLLSGSLVDPVYSFHNCTFQNGQSGGRLMSVENNQVFNVNDAIFPTNTWSGAYNVYKAINAGTVNFVLATGGFAGESFDYDPNNRINWTQRMLNLKAYLEGPFSGTSMSTTLNGILPLSHPYNVTLPYFGGTPKWYYTGTGSVGTIPNANIVDWVLVDVRDAVNAASATPATSIAKIPAFLLNNGSIVALNGSSNLELSNVIVNNLYIAIYHRNHIGIMNADPITYAGGIYTYDYSTGASKVFGGSTAHKQLATGTWGMMSGDGNGNGTIQTNDKTNVWGIQVGTSGYKAGDYNMNRHVNNPDKNDRWLPNLGKSSAIPE